MPHAASTMPVLFAVGRFHVAIAIPPREVCSCAVTNRRPIHGRWFAVIANTGRSIGPDNMRPFETIAPTGTPGGVKRKKSAFTAATARRAGSIPASSFPVVVRPTATSPPFTARMSTHWPRSTSSSDARHGSALCTSRCNCTPGAINSVATESATVRASAATRASAALPRPREVHAANANALAIDSAAMRDDDCIGATSPWERSLSENCPTRVLQN